MFSFPQLERQGFLLVEFEAPLAAGPELPAQRQRVVLEEDVIQFSPTMEYSLRPGDKVLAPWGPDQQRYGPGTVLLGLEARDPQRGKAFIICNSSVQFSSVTQLCPTLCDPMKHSTPGLPVHHQLQEFTQTHDH